MAAPQAEAAVRRLVGVEGGAVAEALGDVEAARVAGARHHREGEAAGLGAGQADVLVEERPQAGELVRGNGDPAVEGDRAGHGAAHFSR